MTKCVKCGGDITEGAKFCSYCGTPVESGTTKDETKERTQVFVGTIRKCPNCGEQIGTNATKCPACGFVIEKRNVSASLDDFVKKLASFDHYAKKREYIENYPVPNNKEDIRDFLTYAASQRDKDYDDNVAKAYWVDAWNNKCRQIVNQAFDTFGMDEDFASWLRNYKAGVEKSSTENEKLKKKLRSIEKGKKRAAGAKKFFKVFGIIVVILAVLGGAGFGIKSCSEKEKEIQKKISEGYSILKENISVSGFLASYIEIADDATITYGYAKDAWSWKKNEYHVHKIVIVPVVLKKDFTTTFEQRYDALLKKYSDEIYSVHIDSYTQCSLGKDTRNSGTTDVVQALRSVKNGEEFSITIDIEDDITYKSVNGVKKALRETVDIPVDKFSISCSAKFTIYKDHQYNGTVPIF